MSCRSLSQISTTRQRALSPRRALLPPTRRTFHVERAGDAREAVEGTRLQDALASPWRGVEWLAPPPTLEACVARGRHRVPGATERAPRFHPGRVGLGVLSAGRSLHGDPVLSEPPPRGRQGTSPKLAPCPSG